MDAAFPEIEIYSLPKRELPDDVDISVLRRQHQRRHPLTLRRVHVGARLQQDPHATAAYLNLTGLYKFLFKWN